MNKVKMAEFLTSLRKEKNLTQQEVSEIFSLTPQAISKWEAGQSIPDVETLEKLSSFYHVSIEEILNGQRQAEPVKASAASVSPSPAAAKPLESPKGLGTFIFSMTMIPLWIAYYFLPAEPPVEVLIGDTQTGHVVWETHSFYYRMSQGDPFAILAFLMSILSSLFALGVWLAPQSMKKGFWLTRQIMAYLCLGLMIAGSLMGQGVYSYVWMAIAFLELIYILLLHLLPMNRLKNL